MDRLAHRLPLSLALAGASLFACAPAKDEPRTPPAATIEESLFFTQTEIVDDPAVAGLAKIMAAFAADGHGGALLEAWFEAFATTPHSARYGPPLLLQDVRAQQGNDATQWDLDALPFRVTAIHNRIDLARNGHCGELRVSFASTHATQQPLHLIFLFRQPGPDCEALAWRWAELAESPAFAADAKALLGELFVPENALLAETLEQTVSPWEWRQWTFDGGVPANPPLFQTVDIERLNQAGTERDAFLAWVDANAAAIDARSMEIPPQFRSQSARVADGVPRVPLDLTGSAAVATYPEIRKQLEIVGCPVCHTTDANFLQTRSDRTPSPFYEKELDARLAHLTSLVAGAPGAVPFGPLQPAPVLPD